MSYCLLRVSLIKHGNCSGFLLLSPSLHLCPFWFSLQGHTLPSTGKLAPSRSCPCGCVSSSLLIKLQSHLLKKKKNFMGSDRLLMFPHQVSLITLGEHSVAKFTSSVYLRVKKAETIRSGSLVLVDVNLCATDCPVASACY